MQPINHLDSVSVFCVGDVEVVLLLNDFEALYLSEFGFLVVKKHFFWICDVEESPISINLGFGITWKMSPNILSLWAEDYLFCCKFLEFWMNDEGTHKNDKTQYE